MLFVFGFEIKVHVIKFACMFIWPHRINSTFIKILQPFSQSFILNYSIFTAFLSCMYYLLLIHAVCYLLNLFIVWIILELYLIKCGFRSGFISAECWVKLFSSVLSVKLTASFRHWHINLLLMVTTSLDAPMCYKWCCHIMLNIHHIIRENLGIDQPADTCLWILLHIPPNKQINIQDLNFVNCTLSVLAGKHVQNELQLCFYPDTFVRMSLYELCNYYYCYRTVEKLIWYHISLYISFLCCQFEGVSPIMR